MGLRDRYARRHLLVQRKLSSRRNEAFCLFPVNKRKILDVFGVVTKIKYSENFSCWGDAKDTKMRDAGSWSDL